MVYFAPLPDVSYRIENDGFGSFLHLSNPGTQNAKLKMQPMQNSQKQHWIFIEQAGGYKIQNVASKSSQAQSGFLGAGNESPTVVSETEAPLWTIRVLRGAQPPALDENVMYCYPRGERIYLGLNDEGGFSLLDEVADPESPTDTLRWRVHNVVPSVPGGIMISKGTYRIRTLDGLAIHVEGNLVSTKDQTEGAFQEWDVEPVGSGRYTIKNRGSSSYLHWMKLRSHTFVACVKSTVLSWELTSLGGGYVFSIRAPTPPEEYAGYDYQASLTPNTNYDDIILAMNHVTYTLDKAVDLWIFEPVYEGRHVAVALRKVNGRYPEVTEGVEYWIQSWDFGRIAYSYPPKLECFFVSSWGFTSYEKAKWRIKYHGTTSPQFEIFCENTPNLKLGVAGGQVILDYDVPLGIWVLERSIIHPQKYYICLAGDQEKVISANTSNNDWLAIQKKDVKSRLQLWEFITP